MIFWTFQDVENGHQNFPNQYEFGLEYASSKINFLPNQTGIGLEKAAEWNVAVVKEYEPRATPLRKVLKE